MTPIEHEMTLADLRDGLGMVCQHVARTNETVVVTRYGKGIAVVVPLGEWRSLKALEADLRAGRKQLVDGVSADGTDANVGGIAAKPPAAPGFAELPEIVWDIAGTVVDEPVSDSPDAGRRSPRDTTNTTAENDDGHEEVPGEESDPEEGGEG